MSSSLCVSKALINTEKLWYDLVPQPFRFVTSGLLGNVVFFLMDKSFLQFMIQIQDQLPKLINKHKETISFFISYMGQIIIQHLLHAFLVFGRDSISTTDKYFKTLMASYQTYFGVVLGSTAMNYCLLNILGVPKDIAFVLTLGGFGLLAYFILERMMGSSSSGSTSTEDDRTTQTSQHSADSIFEARGGEVVMNPLRKIHLNKTPGLSLFSSTLMRLDRVIHSKSSIIF